MDYIRNSADGQLVFTQSTEFFKIHSCLYGFVNLSTSTEATASGRTAFCFHCTLDASEDDITCQCGSRMQFISFKAPGHRVTEELCQYTRDLLATGNYTNKEVAELTGLSKNTVKDIDKQRRLIAEGDDEYFFLKLFDISRKTYVRNPLSHKICD